MPTLKYRDPNSGLFVPYQVAAPSEVQVGGIPDSQVELWMDTASGVPGVDGVPGRNRLINGDMSVNQRGFSYTTSSPGWTFLVDRWMGIFSAGTNALATIAPNPGDLPESAKQFIRVSSSGQNAASGYSELMQQIEDVRTLSGKTVTLSFWARATPAAKVAVSYAQGFGTGGSASVLGHAGVINVGASWARYTLTFNMPSLAGKTIGTGSTYSELRFWTSAGTDHAALAPIGVQNSILDFWGVQLEEGPVATRFDQRTYADELWACQRYYAMIVNYTGAAYAASSSIARLGITYPRVMRRAPTITLGAPGIVNGTVGNPAPTSLTVQAAYTQNAYLDLNFPATFTAGVGLMTYGQWYLLDAEL